jgi:hypothetical protein
MPTKKKSAIEIDDDDRNEAVAACLSDPDQRYKVFILDFVNGKRRPCYLETIQGYDIDFVKEKFGGGTFEIKPIDESEKFVKGGFSVTIAGPRIPLEKMVTGSEDGAEESPEDDAEPVLDGGGSEARMLKYLMDRNRELEDKVDGFRSGGSSLEGEITSENVGQVIDKIMQKQMIYTAMFPILEKMASLTKKSEMDPLQLFKLFTDTLKQGITLGQGVEAPETEDKGLLGVVEKFLPSLMQAFTPKPRPEEPVKKPFNSLLPVQAGNPNIPADQPPPGAEAAESDDMFTFDLPRKISEAISILVRCLNSDIDLSPEEIALDYIGAILSPDDIKVIGDNLSYEKIYDLVSEQVDLEAKLVLRENEDKVRLIIDCVKGIAPSAPDFKDAKEGD